MKMYTFRVVLDGVSVKDLFLQYAAEDEGWAYDKVCAQLKSLGVDLTKVRIERDVDPGMSRMWGSLGGKKSKRVLDEASQVKMQLSRKKSRKVPVDELFDNRAKFFSSFLKGHPVVVGGAIGSGKTSCVSSSVINIFLKEHPMGRLAAFGGEISLQDFVSVSRRKKFVFDPSFSVQASRYSSPECVLPCELAPLGVVSLSHKLRRFDFESAVLKYWRRDFVSSDPNSVYWVDVFYKTLCALRALFVDIKHSDVVYFSDFAPYFSSGDVLRDAVSDCSESFRKTEEFSFLADEICCMDSRTFLFFNTFYCAFMANMDKCSPFLETGGKIALSDLLVAHDIYVSGAPEMRIFSSVLYSFLSDRLEGSMDDPMLVVSSGVGESPHFCFGGDSMCLLPGRFELVVLRQVSKSRNFDVMKGFFNRIFLYTLDVDDLEYISSRIEGSPDFGLGRGLWGEPGDFGRLFPIEFSYGPLANPDDYTEFERSRFLSFVLNTNEDPVQAALKRRGF